MKWVIGIDIGGTTLGLGAVAQDGSTVRYHQSRPTRPERGPEAVVADLVARSGEIIAQLKQGDPTAEILGIGIGAPGPLDTRTGVVSVAPNLGWTDLPLGEMLQTGSGLPVALDNDANCAVLGEYWLGAARGSQHAVGITIGTGIGGGVIIDGQLYHGASDVAGEIGHTTVDIDGRLCGCGNYGCLEAYASGPAIARRAVEQAQAGVPTLLNQLSNGDLTRVTAQTVYEAAAQHDPLALDVVRSTALYLGAGLASLVNVLNPEVIVILGGVTLAGERFFDPMRFEIARRAFKPAVKHCRILPGQLGQFAGIYGAARVFLDRNRNS